MPSFKTTSYDLYFQHLQFFWKHLRFLLAFSAKQAFLRWRFTQGRAKMKVLDTLEKRLVPKASKQCLKQARLFTKMKRKEDEVGIRQKEWLSMKEVKEIVEMERCRNPELADKKVVIKCTRNALRCTNSGCKANFWNRDVNATRNMLEQLKSGLKGKHGARRLRAFQRGQ
ncbi:hypothetical protein BBO99_00001957 [Phytophthora kernoviae]|uniref:Uncharacterized protein n=1 Tax=Phytophthora kernoviae TaxID=325452 RepID=A0A421GZ53_9STRA|nr:hypothetical protein JM16_001638 [Phytophthora kernoviae]RLN83598.1 hypothetical protein BBO99_00001957 [Phytophthora kernoviae]